MYARICTNDANASVCPSALYEYHSADPVKSATGRRDVSDCPFGNAVQDANSTKEMSLVGGLDAMRR